MWCLRRSKVALMMVPAREETTGPGSWEGPRVFCTVVGAGLWRGKGSPVRVVAGRMVRARWMRRWASLRPIRRRRRRNSAVFLQPSSAGDRGSGQLVPAVMARVRERPRRAVSMVAIATSRLASAASTAVPPPFTAS